MTKIYYEATNNEIMISVMGHTDHDVCRAVSVLVQTLAKRLDEVAKESHYEVQSGQIWLRAKGVNVRPAFDTIMCGLDQLAVQFPEHLSIVEGCPIFVKGIMKK
jgi:uncharacterized protein YsxB (DUF464 family)